MNIKAACAPLFCFISRPATPGLRVLQSECLEPCFSKPLPVAHSGLDLDSDESKAAAGRRRTKKTEKNNGFLTVVESVVWRKRRARLGVLTQRLLKASKALSLRQKRKQEGLLMNGS